MAWQPGWLLRRSVLSLRDCGWMIVDA